jgi:hypothetical protein
MDFLFPSEWALLLPFTNYLNCLHLNEVLGLQLLLATPISFSFPKLWSWLCRRWRLMEQLARYFLFKHQSCGLLWVFVKLPYAVELWNQLI